LYQGNVALNSDSIIMARGPGSPGMVGAILAILRGNPRFAKYADQLTSYSDESLGVKVQRSFLKSKFFGGPVMIYGHDDPSRPHLVPINLPLSVSTDEWKNAGKALDLRPAPPPYRLLFVGRLSMFKRIDLLLQATKILLDEGYNIQLDVIGDGETRKNLENISKDLGLSDWVTFHGWLKRQDVFDFYRDAFCLVNCSTRQGIDKVLIEAMTHALPIICTDANMARLILDPPRCGVLYQIANLEELVKQLRTFLNEPSKARAMGLAGRMKTENMQIDHLETMYRVFVREHLNLES